VIDPDRGAVPQATPIRASLISGRVTTRSAVVADLERLGLVIVGEGRTAQDARRLARTCQVVVVDDDADLVEATVPGLRRPVVLLHRTGAPPAAGGAALVIPWPIDLHGGREAVRHIDALLHTSTANRAAARTVTQTAAALTSRTIRPPVAPRVPTASTIAAQPSSDERQPALRRRRPRIVVIGASAGGPAALAALLGDLGTLDVPVVVAQHLHPDFADSLTTWLSTTTTARLHRAEDGMLLQARTVVVASAGGDLTVDGRSRCAVHPPSSPSIPNIDRLMLSVAAGYGAAAIGVILTGMGRDGAAGLLAMRQAGALTIAQDEQTSAVYGMPAAAAAGGAAERVLPLSQIGPAITTIIAEQRAP
jgi:chemotaxis response regulator CheB